MTPETAPTLDRAARRFLDALNGAALHRTGEPTIADLRKAAVEIAKFAEAPREVDRRDDALETGSRQMRLRVYSPSGRGDDELPGLVYFHGGGLVAGNLETHDALTAAIAAGAGCRVIAVDYALAPEARFPAARDDAVAATLRIARDPQRWRLDPTRIALGGDSAGGQLAALAARAARDGGVSLALQFLLCPVMDPLPRTPSRFALAEGYLINEATMQAYWSAYRVDGLEADDPRVAPLAADDFRGLPAALVHVAEGDPLRDEGVAYARALEDAGVPVKLTRHEGLIHHFYGLGAVIPRARVALAGAITQLAAAFSE